MTDFDRLLAAIRANPGEDAPRLVLADWLAGAGRELEAIMQRIIAQPGGDRWRLDYAAELERMAGTVACGACKGKPAIVKLPVPTEIRLADGRIVREIQLPPFKPFGCTLCRGSGRVSDGRAELAAFIRVQVELAARDDERCRCRECQPTGQRHNGPCRSPLKPLRARERELWPAVRGVFDIGFTTSIDKVTVAEKVVIVRRGLPAVVRCTLAEWMGGEECQRCRGVGKIWAAWSVKHESAIYPGRKRVDCPTCHGTGRTPGIGPRLAQAWPVVEVEVSDKTAWRSSSPHFWSWWNENHSNGAVDLDRLAVLPPSIFFKLTDWGSLNSNMYREYDSEPAARAALSDALIEWARGQGVEGKR